MSTGTQLHLSIATQRRNSRSTAIRFVGCKLSTSEVFETYWRFAAERQTVFFRRLENQFPYTPDPILSTFKFTNAYRASDRVSQYLIRRVAYTGEQTADELFFRIILFKLFNRIETWQLLTKTFGEINYREFNLGFYDRVLDDALRKGVRIYSAAYIMPSEGPATHRRKHSSHLRLLQTMMKGSVPQKIAEMRRMQDAFLLLRSFPMIGDFLALQLVTDLNYSALMNFDEMEFVVAGPGAKDGLRKCFPRVDLHDSPDLIRLVTDTQEEHFERLGISFNSLWGRRLQLIDCQNLFCEVGKYSRLAHPDIKGTSGRTRIKQHFVPVPSPLKLFYPPKWKINERIPVSYRSE